MDIKKVLYIDACISRDKSRTERLAQAYLQRLNEREKVDVKTLILAEAGIGPLTEEQCKKRMAFSKTGEFSDPMFNPAKEFKAADIIVMATPYWDLSFPSIVKNYIEQLSVDGLTFLFNEKGEYVSQCQAEKLVYITTAGGYIGNDNFGFEYVRAVFDHFFGIRDAEFIAADGLDIIGADVEGILEDVIRRM